MAKHRADGGKGFDPKGRSTKGAEDGEQNPGRKAEAEGEAPYSQAEADRRAQAYRDRKNQ